MYLSRGKKKKNKQRFFTSRNGLEKVRKDKVAKLLERKNFNGNPPSVAGIEK